MCRYHGGMSRTSRRSFVARSAAILPIAQALFAHESMRDSNLGVQLYTVRNIIDKSPATTLREIQNIGYTEVEAIYADLEHVGPALKESGLKPVSVHIDYKIFKAGGADLDTAFSRAKQFGFEYVVMPYVPVEDRGGSAVFKRTGEMLNSAGEKAKAAGLQLCYHNHAFDFQPVDGTTGLSLMMNNTQKGLVSLELDIFWAAVAGHDPVQVLKTFSGRVALLHLKNKAASLTTPQYNENVPKSAFKEVGAGSIDVPAVLNAADREGVQNYFVEQDQTPGNPIASLRASYEYLKPMFNG